MSANVQVNADVNGAISFWQTPGYDLGFFEFYKDLPTCLGVWCCFPCSMGYVAGQVDKKGFNITACLCAGLYEYKLRKEVQAKYNITENGDASVCGVGLCGCCAAVQDIHQLEKMNEIKFLGGANQQAATTAQPAAAEAPAQ